MNQIKAGDLVRAKKHIGLQRPVFKVERVVDNTLVYMEGFPAPSYAGLWEKLVCEVRNDDGSVFNA